MVCGLTTVLRHGEILDRSEYPRVMFCFSEAPSGGRRVVAAGGAQPSFAGEAQPVESEREENPVPAGQRSFWVSELC